MKEDRKRLKDEYKRGRREAGVFQIRNTANGKVLVVSALDLPGLMNRHRFELAAGGHMNRALQSEWDEFGGEAFAFEVLDRLVPREGTDPRAELKTLEDLWLERLNPYGDRGYNEPKATPDEKLRRIAARRLQEG
ncbi:MAG TPA: GIY-YIG nuclease family protein [Pyrinomonadaceae bacterium]|nr:GIY-YIG nuclease family protein [Pyrinomonadaceae bacterium]